MQAASRGDAPAQSRLGAQYLRGEGVEADSSRAILWLEQAADQGHTAAGDSLALIELDGDR